MQPLLSPGSLSARLALYNLGNNQGRRVWRRNPPYSKPVIDRLVSLGLATLSKRQGGTHVLEITTEGRAELARLVAAK